MTKKNNGDILSIWTSDTTFSEFCITIEQFSFKAMYLKCSMNNNTTFVHNGMNFNAGVFSPWNLIKQFIGFYGLITQYIYILTASVLDTRL